MSRAKETVTTSTQHNILAPGTKLKGEISTEEDFRVDGTIEGDIICQGKIIIGQGGLVAGNISCTNIEVFGEVKGNISCKETLILRSSAKQTGSMKMQIIEIEQGAQIVDSTLSMMENSSNMTIEP